MTFARCIFNWYWDSLQEETGAGWGGGVVGGGGRVGEERDG